MLHFIVIFRAYGGTVAVMQAIQERINKIFTSKKFNLIAFGIIAAMILIAHSNTFTASFHFDDNPTIVENPFIKRFTWDNVLNLLHGNRPVLNMSLLINYQLSGLNVVGWHIFNIGCHIANSFFVYLLILWTLTLPALNRRYGERAKSMALFGALLFGVHPIQTESVTYIISRSELLAAFFFLITFLLFIKGAQKNRYGYYVLAFFTSLCAMGSKEWAATLPAMLLVYDYMFLSEGSLRKVMKRWQAYVLLFLPWVFMAYILSFYQGATSAGFSITGQKGITPWTYLLTSFNVIWTYVRLLILPINQNLDYDYPLATTLFEFPTLLSFIGHVAVVIAAVWLFKKRGWLLAPFGVAWFYIVLSPTQSFVPILDVIFEHRLYMPSLGFFLAFVAGFEALFGLGRSYEEVNKVLVNKKAGEKRLTA